MESEYIKAALRNMYKQYQSLEWTVQAIHHPEDIHTKLTDKQLLIRLIREAGLIQRECTNMLIEASHLVEQRQDKKQETQTKESEPLAQGEEPPPQDDR